jgi:hypothetical protein
MAVNPNTFDPSSVVTNEETKFCTLPGQEPISLSTEHGGHGCRIGDTPRTVPLFFHQEAIARGAYTEEQIIDLKSRLAGVETPGAPLIQADTPATPPLTLLQDSDDDGFALKSPTPASPAATSERTEQIKAAIIDLLNTGNPSDFTSTGTPKVEVLKEKLGFEVTGPERDAAYEAAKG